MFACHNIQSRLAHGSGMVVAYCRGSIECKVVHEIVEVGGLFPVHMQRSSTTQEWKWKVRMYIYSVRQIKLGMSIRGAFRGRGAFAISILFTPSPRTIIVPHVQYETLKEIYSTGYVCAHV